MVILSQSLLSPWLWLLLVLLPGSSRSKATHVNETLSSNQHVRPRLRSSARLESSTSTASAPTVSPSVSTVPSFLPSTSGSPSSSNSPTRQHLIDPLFPLTDEKMELIERLSVYCVLSYRSNRIDILKKISEGSLTSAEFQELQEERSSSLYNWQNYILENMDSLKNITNVTRFGQQDEVDVAMIVEERDSCIAVFRGTEPEVPDWFQNLDLRNIEECSRSNSRRCCNVRRGFRGAYTSHEYYRDFERALEQCMMRNSRLYFTGHSQGAGISQVATLIWEDYDPVSVNFAPPPAFSGDNCNVVIPENMWNFVNTEIDEFLSLSISTLTSIDYDPVATLPTLINWLITDPILGGVPTAVLFQGLTAILGPVSPQAANFLVNLYRAVKRVQAEEGNLAYGHLFGPVIFFPPGAPSGDPSTFQSKSAVHYKSYDETPEFDIRQLDFGGCLSSLGCKDPNGLKGVSIHSSPNYMRKMIHLRKEGANLLDVFAGFEDGTYCNFDEECQKGVKCNRKPALVGKRVCNALNRNEQCVVDADCLSDRCRVFRCVARNAESCLSDDECESGRCSELDAFTCQEKLGRNQGCLSDSDCQAGLECLGNLRCGPVDNGQVCLTDPDCLSERCSELDGFTCQEKLGRNQGCLSDSDCQAGLECLGNLRCGPVDNGQVCLTDPDCLSGRCSELDGFTCQEKLGRNQGCLSDSDCQAGLDCRGGAQNLRCGPFDNGQGCLSSPDCLSGRCALQNGLLTCLAKLGRNQGRCLGDSDCQAGLTCRGGAANRRCGPFSNNQRCGSNSDCLSGRCRGPWWDLRCR